MDQNTQLPESEVLENQLRECFARVVYSHKTHEKQADITSTQLARFKLTQVALSALTSSGALATMFAEDFYLKCATAAVSLVSLFVTGYMKGFDPGAVAQKHRDTAADLWSIRESYLSLLTDYANGTVDRENTCKKRDQLQADLAAIYKSAPGTTPKSYLSAQEALQKLEDYTFNPGEIDKFLPPALKRDTGKLRGE
ncbi:SLATT domain-containing protein [Phaeobacter inhibens]|uniref:SLATT domain-containing protein n=1 Tax=Phaeobacter inhibens TaxID=221822 RepID=UPI0021A55901|nr:SLATT domain-containing protein [Phaeobacter inhibens]